MQLSPGMEPQPSVTAEEKPSCAVAVHDAERSAVAEGVQFKVNDGWTGVTMTIDEAVVT